MTVARHTPIVPGLGRCVSGWRWCGASTAKAHRARRRRRRRPQDQGPGTGIFVLRELFPGLTIDVEELFHADGDRVVARLAIRASATSRAPSWSAIQIFTFRDSAIAEVWGLSDPLPWLQAIGAVPDDSSIQARLDRYLESPKRS